MPRPRLQYLHRETNRHGKTVWYVRVGKGPRIRIRSEYGSDQFAAEYQSAINGERPTKAASNGTLAWLISRYHESAAWRALSPATRRQRENIFRHIIESAGGEPIRNITRSVIIKGRDRRSATPAQARHFIDTMRGLFRFAVDAELASSDPTAGVIARKPKTKGFPVWTQDEIDAFQNHWPRGTRERLMFDIFLYTGLRRGDAARLGKQHIRNGVLCLDTEKTGTRVTIPILPELQETLDAGPTGDLALIASEYGRGMRKEVVGNLFAKACRAAGIRKSAHGLRKAAATHAANRGATVAQLEAIFGWEGGRMASLYTRSADREALAMGAMAKLSREGISRTSIPAPDGETPAPKKITKKIK